MITLVTILRNIIIATGLSLSEGAGTGALGTQGKPWSVNPIGGRAGDGVL